MHAPAGRLALAVAAVAGGTALVGSPLAAPASGQAAASAVYVSPGGSDAGQCTQEAPCKSLARAYALAAPGAQVLIGAGRYPAQSVPPETGKPAPAVVFRPQDGSLVTLESLIVRASHVEFRDLHVSEFWYVGANSSAVAAADQPHDVTMRDVDASRIFVTGAADVSVLGGSIGPAVDSSSEIKACSGCTYAPTRILLDGVTFHDYTRSTPGTHMQCLQVYPAQELTIRNSRFSNCAIMDLFLSNYGRGGDLRGITIENSVFDRPGSHAAALSSGSSALSIAPNGRSLTDVRIAYNSLLATLAIGAAARIGGVTVDSNVGSLASWSCAKGVTYAHNVWTGAKCGPSDVVAASGFADPDALDLHLVRGAAAIGGGDAADHPATDIDGTPRPTRAPPDAGAYQWETPRIVLGRSIGAATIGEPSARLVAFYGPPQRTAAARSRAGGELTLAYRVHGGTLWVVVRRGVVVGVATDARYYETAGKLGVGSSMAPVRGWRGLAWRRCQRAFRRAFGAVSVYVAPAGGRLGGTVKSVAMVRPGVEAPTASARC